MWCGVVKVRMNEIREREAKAGNAPTMLKAVVSADLIKKVTRVLGRYSLVSAAPFISMASAVF